MTTQSRELGSNGSAPDQQRRATQLALQSAGVAVLYQDASLHYLWAENLPPSWPVQQVAGLTDFEIIPAASVSSVLEAKQAVLRSGQGQRAEVSLQARGRLLHFALAIEPDHDEREQIAGLVTTVTEVTERKVREQVTRALLREVSHRSKNLLAVVQSIAMQTARYSESLDDFLRKFRGRLQSVSSSQDLVTAANWQPVTLRALIGAQLGSYLEQDGARVLVQGENPSLSPNAALHVGLALHELTINSVADGALSASSGSIRIEAHYERTPENEEALCLSWAEQFEGVVGDMVRRFGSAVLERVVPVSVNGEATYNIGDNGVRFMLRIPATQFSH